MKLNQKGLAPIVIILITAIVSLGVAGGGVWYYQDQQAKRQKEDSDKKVAELQKQVEDSKKQIEELQKSNESEKTTESTDETANWKTYTATKFDFSVKYPSSLSISDCQGLFTAQDGPTFIASWTLDKNNKCNTSPVPSPGIVVEEYPNNPTDGGKFTPDQQRVLKKEDIKINGIDVRKVWWKTDNEHPGKITTAFYKNGRSILLQLEGENSTIETIYNKMINALKFTK